MLKQSRIKTGSEIQPSGPKVSFSATIEHRGEIPCIAKNVSNVGAAIYVAPDVPALPVEFYILIAGETNSRCCAVVRRGKKVTRVVFV